MAVTFDKVFDLVMKLEGGLVLHKNPTEEAETYAGIYRKAHPNWEGWTYIDEGVLPNVQLVKDFYKRHFWDVVQIENDLVKGMLFEYGVNVGVVKAIRVLQSAIGEAPDGVIGSRTKARIGSMDKDCLIKLFTLGKIEMYTDLVNGNSSKYGVYLRGWLNRAFNSQKWFKDNLL